MSLKRFFTGLFLSGAIVSATNAQVVPVPDSRLPNFKSIETGFITVPDNIQTSVYWYWISDNISKEGVVKDLEAMKRVGINRAFIGNIGIDDMPFGKVKIFTPEWWDILHTALKTATRLHIDIGLFNSPGWSQSGGPWVKPEQAMRYLTSSQTVVTGPQRFNQKLPKPIDIFQDVRVIAYPRLAHYGASIGDVQTIYLNANPRPDDLNNLMDGKESTTFTIPRGASFSVNIGSPKEFTARSLTIIPAREGFSFTADIQVKINGEYTTVKHFAIDRGNTALNVGFSPFGPVAVSIPATTSNDFRLVFNHVSNNCKIAEIKLSGTPVVENYIEKTEAKMWPTPHPFWEAYQWAPQPVVDDKTLVIDPNKVIDITKYMAADGTLKWDVPAGDWIIERSGMTPTGVKNSPATPEGTGLETDKMSIRHINSHFDAYLGEIIRRIPAEDRKSLKVTVEDSYETGGQNWTDELTNEFKQTYHYDPVPYIPVMQGKVVGSEDQSDRFLWDLRRLIADDVSYKYVGGLRDISHKHGLTTWLENYGHWGYPGEFLQYGGQSDEIGGEFWSEGDLGDIENKAASSSAHIYGKTKVSAESFTAAGDAFWRYPAMFKKRGDRFFTEGINNTLLHVYIQQAADKGPGLDTWFGVEFNRLNTWFYDMDVFLKYSKRCNMMLQQGIYSADVAYFIGEDAPKMTGIVEPALPQGYSFDYINGEVLKNRASVKNGKLVLPNGISYSILVLPKLETMRPELLAKLKELVSQGLVILGPKPSRSPSLQGYPQADNRVQAMAYELWGDADGVKVKVHHYGKGLVLSGMDMQQALDMVKVIPDCKISQSDSILFIHRQLKDGSIYFISNQKTSAVNISPKFRITGLQPELWNAVNGDRRSLPSYYQANGTTTVPMKLAPYESAFIVFRKPGMKKDTSRANYPHAMQNIAVNKPWTVNFDSKMRGPTKAVVFNELTDWSKSDNDSIKYYSGTAYYHNSFNITTLAKGTNYILDLGLARAIAKVKINGIDVGGVWTPPYQLDITRALKPGANKIEVKVVNTWVNRLIGDSKLPEAERKATAVVMPNMGKGLESSGLLGPVKVSVVKY